jgi:hypothetical protein
MSPELRRDGTECAGQVISLGNKHAPSREIVRQDRSCETLYLREPAVRGVGIILTNGRIECIYEEIAVSRNIRDKP